MKYPLKPVADHLASKGRNGDDTLVHVSRDELRGLAALHPKGKLPINPETGHAEAFDLGGMLASLVGGTAGFFVGGPMGAAVGSGLGSYAYSGDLGQGIASGLLSYGLGSAIGGLGGFGAEAATEATKAASSGAAAGLGDTAAALGSNGAPGFDLAGGVGSPLNAPTLFSNPGEYISGKATGYMDTLGKAAGNATNPEALWDTFGKNALKTTVPIGLGAYTMMNGTGSGQAGIPPQQQTYGTTSTQGTGRQYVGPPSGYRPGKDPEWDYFQGGRYGYAGGGPISGPGGGLDDSIPAIIDGRQPAALSSGEFVVPAHAVSALGNGSTEEGVRQLDSMVDRVMQHKYGTTDRKPNPLKPERTMAV